MLDRLTSATITGGSGLDTISIGAKSESTSIKLGDDNDVVTTTTAAVAKHNDLKIKGNQGNDTITLTATFTGRGSGVYGGKDDDSIVFNTNAAVVVTGDAGDDIITDAGVGTTSLGASIYGGSGDDTVELGAGTANGKLFVKTNAGDDSITASIGADVIYAGQGDDTINGGAAAAKSATYYGDKGDDQITLDSTKASLASGGTGDDTITIETVSTDKAGTTVDGGAGADELTVVSSQGSEQYIDAGGGVIRKDYAPQDGATVLKYASAAEFLANNKLVDKIEVAADDLAIAEIPEALKITASDDFSRSTTTGGRADGREGLLIKTSSTVTAASTVTLGALASDYIQGIDLSAGTTGNSSISAAADTQSKALRLVGGKGKNTITGGKGADAIVGNSADDVLTGGDGADRITTGDGRDTVKGGKGNDTIVMGKKFDGFDSIDGGADTDTLQFTDNGSGTDDLDKIANIEAVQLGNADANITLKTGVVAAGKSLSISFETATTTNKLTLDANDALGTVSVTGAKGADIITGGDAADTITGGEGADNLTGDAGADVFAYKTSSDGTDTIADFEQGTDLIAIADAIINPGATAPGDASFAAGDFETRANIAAIVAGDALHVVKVTTATAAADALTQTGGAADAVVILSDNTDGQLIYDNNWSDTANRVVLANLTGINTADLAAITATSFVNIA